MTGRPSVRESVARITLTFYSAFTNSNRHAPIDSLYDICLPEAVIVNATNEPPAIYNLREFVEPRRQLLESGTLSDFKEYEVSSEMEFHGRIAQRISRYEKAWTERGMQMRGAGTKMFSFVQMPQGWRIASVLWHDAATCVIGA
jgi:hypothetical protein